MNEIRKRIVQFHTSGKGPSEIVRLMKVEKVNRMIVYRTLILSMRHVALRISFGLVDLPVLEQASSKM